MFVNGFGKYLTNKSKKNYLSHWTTQNLTFKKFSVFSISWKTWIWTFKVLKGQRQYSKKGVGVSFVMHAPLKKTCIIPNMKYWKSDRKLYFIIEQNAIGCWCWRISDSRHFVTESKDHPDNKFNNKEFAELAETHKKKDTKRPFLLAGYIQMSKHTVRNLICSLADPDICLDMPSMDQWEVLN